MLVIIYVSPRSTHAAIELLALVPGALLPAELAQALVPLRRLTHIDLALPRYDHAFTAEERRQLLLVGYVLTYRAVSSHHLVRRVRRPRATTGARRSAWREARKSSRHATSPRR